MELNWGVGASILLLQLLTVLSILGAPAWTVLPQDIAASMIQTTAENTSSTTDSPNMIEIHPSN